GGFVLFGWLSDRIGRKPIILAGCLLAVLTYFPLFKAITATANPALYYAHQTVPVTVHADPANCSFQFNPVGTAQFTTPCDIAKGLLARSSVVYNFEAAPAGSIASVRVGNQTIEAFDARAAGADAAARGAAFTQAVNAALTAAGYPPPNNPTVVRMSNPLD